MSSQLPLKSLQSQLEPAYIPFLDEQIRVDAIWLAAEPFDMRAGTESALSRVVTVFGAAHLHHAYLFANRRANQIKVLVHDGVGIWLAAWRLHAGMSMPPRSASAPTRMPMDDDAALFAALLALSHDETVQLLAVCVASTVDVVTGRAQELPGALLAQAVGLDMRACPPASTPHSSFAMSCRCWRQCGSATASPSIWLPRSARPSRLPPAFSCPRSPSLA